MICDQAGGPQWMILEAIRGYGGTRKDNKIIPGVFKKNVDAIYVKGDDVIIKLPMPYPPLLGILQFSSSAIICKSWAIKNGCWDGLLKNAHIYNGPGFNLEPLQKITNGTGAYNQDKWIISERFIFERFDDYWGK